MLSRYYKNKLLNHSLGVEAFTMPTQVYIGLFTTLPTSDTNAGIEVSGGGYVRQELDVSTATLGTTSNSILIQYPVATEEWGTIVGAGIYDALTGGNWLISKAVTIQNPVNVGKQYQFSIGNAQIQFI